MIQSPIIYLQNEAELIDFNLTRYINDSLSRILFTNGGGKLLLTQVVSARYSIQDDGVLFLLFELCEITVIQSA